MGAVVVPPGFISPHPTPRGEAALSNGGSASGHCGNELFSFIPCRNKHLTPSAATPASISSPLIKVILSYLLPTRWKKLKAPHPFCRRRRGQSQGNVGFRPSPASFAHPFPPVLALAPRWAAALEKESWGSQIPPNPCWEERS